VVEAYSPLGRGADLEHPVLTGIAADHDRTPAQVVLRWQLRRGRVVSPKSATPERIRANYGVFDCELADDGLSRLDRLEAGQRTGNDPRTFSLSQFRPIPGEDRLRPRRDGSEPRH